LSTDIIRIARALSYRSICAIVAQVPPAPTATAPPGTTLVWNWSEKLQQADGLVELLDRMSTTVRYRKPIVFGIRGGYVPSGASDTVFPGDTAERSYILLGPQQRQPSWKENQKRGSRSETWVAPCSLPRDI